MGTLGKYTQYVGGVATAAHKLLSTLFPDGPYGDNTPGTPLAKGDETAAQALIIAVATSNPGPDPNGGGLQPSSGMQAGNLQIFPAGVDLSFAGKALSAPNGPPDPSTVAWKNPGDPANGYIPDITSPTAGPGHTLGKDKTGDPTATIPEIVAEATDQDPVGQDTRNPIKDGPAIYSSNTVGNPQKLGDSGGNV